MVIVVFFLLYKFDITLMVSVYMVYQTVGIICFFKFLGDKSVLCKSGRVFFVLFSLVGGSTTQMWVTMCQKENKLKIKTMFS